MSERTDYAMLARNRASSFRWLASRPPERRELTKEELHILAREADSFANVFEQLEKELLDALGDVPEKEPS